MHHGRDIGDFSAELFERLERYFHVLITKTKMISNYFFNIKA